MDSRVRGNDHTNNVMPAEAGIHAMLGLLYRGGLDSPIGMPLAPLSPCLRQAGGNDSNDIVIPPAQAGSFEMKQKAVISSLFFQKKTRNLIICNSMRWRGTFASLFTRDAKNAQLC